MNYKNLDDDFALVVVVAESSRRATLLLLEDAVEVTDVVEAATVANLCHAGMCVDKQTGGIAQTNVDDVVAHSLARTGTEETRESGGSHACNISQSLQSDFPLEVLVDMLFDGTDATAFGCVLDIGKRFAGQQMVVILKRELVENLEQRKHAIETGLSRSDVRYLSIQLHNGRQLEGYASLGILEKGTKAAQLVLLEELLTKQVGGKLNGDFVDGMALAIVLVPHVLETAANKHEVVLAKHLDTVANNAAGTIAMFHEVQLHLFVFVKRISERVFVTVDHQEAILLSQWRDLSNYFVSHSF